MSQTLFLSTVTSEFGPLRLRLAVLLQRTKRVHVRHQDDFFHHGVKTLRMLEEEVAASEMIIHVIGKEPGWCPPVDQVGRLFASASEVRDSLPGTCRLRQNGNYFGDSMGSLAGSVLSTHSQQGHASPDLRIP